MLQSGPEIITRIPGIDRIQDITWYSPDCFGVSEVKDRLHVILSIAQFTRVDGINDGTRVLEWDALANTKFAPSPNQC